MTGSRVFLRMVSMSHKLGRREEATTLEALDARGIMSHMKDGTIESFGLWTKTFMIHDKRHGFLEGGNKGHRIRSWQGFQVSQNGVKVGRMGIDEGGNEPLSVGFRDQTTVRNIGRKNLIPLENCKLLCRTYWTKDLQVFHDSMNVLKFIVLQNGI